MRYLIDSDWLIDFMKGRPAAVQFIGGLTPSETLVSIISYGVIFASQRSRREAEFSRLVELVEIVGLDTETMDIFALLRGTLERSGKKLSDFDLLIAATAIRRDLILVARNVGHVQRVPGLRLFENNQSQHF